MSHDERFLRLEASFREQLGYWNEALRLSLEADPDFFEAFLELASVPHRNAVLDPRVRELVLVAVDGAATHLYAPGFREHVRLAIAHGATREELLEVLELTATLGIHACNVGVPILLDALDAAGLRVEESPRSERQDELKRTFERNRGYWNPFWDGVLDLDPDFFSAYLEFSSIPWRQGVLEPKIKELIYIAFDAAATHMFLPGLKLHIENALGLGASAAEVMSVLELASSLGMHAVLSGVPVILEELERARRNAP